MNNKTKTPNPIFEFVAKYIIVDMNVEIVDPANKPNNIELSNTKNKVIINIIKLKIVIPIYFLEL